MSTTVDELSYTPSQEEKTRDAEQIVATGRKSWKTLRGKGEAVWPPILLVFFLALKSNSSWIVLIVFIREAALIEGAYLF